MNNKGKIQEFKEFAFEIKINRDYYSRARIIEELVNKVDELFKEETIDNRICKHSNCIEVATMDYNGDKVCEYHYKKLNDYFDEEYR